VAHATPAWIIPVIGLLDIPLAGPQLGLAGHHELMVFALAAGVFFTIPIFTLIFARLLFEERMPEALQPTLLILVAPFAVGYSTYETVAGANDLFAHSLYTLAMFLLGVLLAQLGKAPRTRFYMTWWATSFPLAASTIAALNFSLANPSTLAQAVAWVLLAFSTVVIGTLLLLSIKVIAKGELRLSCTH
jgi:tellurite resistance protein